MKIILKFLFSFCLSYLMAACDSMNSAHEEYLERGEGIYTGVIDSLKAFPGNNRLKLSWEINADPRITQTVIYWNERADSVVVPVNRTTSGIIALDTTFNLPEKSYLIEIITRDDFGNKSLYVQKSVEVYGNKYIALLKNRMINSFNAISPNKTITLNWRLMEDLRMQYTLVQYTDHTDPLHPVAQSVKVENKEVKTVLSGIQAGDKITITSSFLPTKEALDIVDALPKTYHLPMK